MSNSIVVRGQPIIITQIDDEELFDAHDLWVASGFEDKNNPRRWMRNDKTQQLILTAQRKTGTVHAVKETTPDGKRWKFSSLIMLAYATWINAEFHFEVLDAFLKHVRGETPTPVAPTAPTFQLDDLLDQLVDRVADRLGNRQAPKADPYENDRVFTTYDFMRMYKLPTHDRAYCEYRESEMSQWVLDMEELFTMAIEEGIPVVDKTDPNQAWKKVYLFPETFLARYFDVDLPNWQ